MKNTLKAFGLLSILLLPACVSTTSRPAPHSDSSFQSAHDLYLNGRYERAVDAFTDILRSRERRGDESLIARTYQYRGESRMSTGWPASTTRWP
jgi:hypothetical protein